MTAKPQFIPLADAVWRFAPRKLITERNRAARDAAQAPSHPNQSPSTPNFDDLLAALNETMERSKRRDEPRRRAEEHLYDLLRREELEAWGVMTKPDQRSERERIPSVLFD